MMDSFSITRPEEYECVDGLIYDINNFRQQIESLGFSWSGEICHTEEQGYSLYEYPVSGDYKYLSYKGNIVISSELCQDLISEISSYYWVPKINTDAVTYEWKIIGNWYAENVLPLYYNSNDYWHSDYWSWVKLDIFSISTEPEICYEVLVDGHLTYQLSFEEISPNSYQKSKIQNGKTITDEIHLYGNTPSDLYIKMDLGTRWGWQMVLTDCVIEIYPNMAQIANINSGNQGKFVQIEKDI